MTLTRFAVLFTAAMSAAALTTGVASAAGNAGISSTVARSADGRPADTAEGQQATREFWTPERMMASVPADLPGDVVPARRKAAPTGPAGRIDPVAPAVRPAVPSEVGALAQYPSRSVGKVFFRLPGDGTLWHCSATTIGSASRRLVLTAGHCVHSGGPGGGWATEFLFVPYYDRGSRPHGTFAATYLTSKDPWVQDRNFYYDMGIAIVATNESGRRVVDEVGGNGAFWNEPREVHVVAQGYPLDIDGGERAKLCEGDTERVSLVDWRPAFPCGFGHGASGGPWFQEYEEDPGGWGFGYVNGVTSTGADGGRIATPYFDDDFKSLYDFAESHA